MRLCDSVIIIIHNGDQEELFNYISKNYHKATRKIENATHTHTYIHTNKGTHTHTYTLDAVCATLDKPSGGECTSLVCPPLPLLLLQPPN